MKTLSIKEPFASLIINGYKKYEFRTYKINYQGKLLIHASSKFNKNVLAKYKSLNINYRPGYIIGEVNIKKCIPLTEEFINELKKASFLLKDIKNKFIKSNLDDNYDKGKLKIYIYKKPKYHISIKEFFENCTKEEV